MNPNIVARNRTARLVREARTPTFTSQTGITREQGRARRFHTKVVEVESELGGRFWSAPMHELRVDSFCDAEAAIGYSISDIDCAMSCFCTPDED